MNLKKRNFRLSPNIATFKNIRVKERLSGWSHSAFADSSFWLFLAVWFVPLLICLLYIIFNFSRLPNEIPLFYSRIWGEAQLAKKTYIFLPVGGVFLLGIGNLSLMISFHFRDRVFAYLLAGTSSLLAILVLVTTFNIINLFR